MDHKEFVKNALLTEVLGAVATEILTAENSKGYLRYINGASKI
ncbi:hypothetical protein [Arcticibacterium luteifluviistationis]|nr:hypothetical protein [Arcticibacterium luteifluviistationis]